MKLAEFPCHSHIPHPPKNTQIKSVTGSCSKISCRCYAIASIYTLANRTINSYTF
ncbi:hypothetical protein FDUTEX481_06521 [Tolypothrix sp. PCC 7601]|nr:hypothetical protein FDUTEX481_06521 [Tolypothrix sp. PCC 7601]